MIRTCKPYRVDFLTDGSGDDSEILEVANGKLLAVLYLEAAGAAAFTDGVNLIITEQHNDVDVQMVCTIPAGSMNATLTAPFRPLNLCHTTAGVAITDAYQAPIISDGKLKLTIADGGAANTGTVIVVIGE